MSSRSRSGNSASRSSTESPSSQVLENNLYRVAQATHARFTVTDFRIYSNPGQQIVTRHAYTLLIRQTHSTQSLLSLLMGASLNEGACTRTRMTHSPGILPEGY